MAQTTQTQRSAQSQRGNQANHLPVESFRIGSVGVSIFENESQNEPEGNGRPQKYYRAKVDKRYCDAKTGEWNSSNSFSLDDLLRLRHVVDRAIDYMCSRPAGVKQSESNERVRQ
jgi:hypothetical protein